MKNCGCILYYKPQDSVCLEHPILKKEDFVLIIMNEGQKEMLQRYGNDCICLDGTHGINAYGFELNTLLVLDQMREGFPSSFLISNRSDKSVMTIFFSHIGEVLDTQIKPKVFMSDMAESFYNAWQKVMLPADVRLFCTWHVDRAWRKNLKKVGSKEMQVVVYKKLRALLQETDVTAFNRMIQNFFTSLLLNPMTSEFASYFQQNYLHNVTSWAYCHRLHAGLNTNMHIERMHRSISIKYLYLHGKANKRLDKAINAILKFVRDKLFDQIISQNKGKLCRTIKVLRQRHKTSEKLDINSILAIESTDTTTTTWQVPSSSSSEIYVIEERKSNCDCKLVCTDCNVCLHNYSCTCLDSSVQWNMCKHIHLVCRYRNSQTGEPSESEFTCAVFQDDNPEAEVAFRYAISRLNMYTSDYQLYPFIRRFSSLDSFSTGQIVCELAQKGIAAIFGPDSPTTNEIIQSISTNLEIPQFQVFWNPKLAHFSEYEQDKPNLVFNLFPDPHTLAKGFATLLREMKWKKYVVIYEHDEGLVRLQEVLKAHGPKDPPVTVRKLGPGPDHRPVLKEIKESSVLQIILDCETDHILDILEQAKEVKLMEEYHSYILTSLDTHSVDFGALKETKSNITSLRLIDPNTTEIRMVARDWELGQLNHNNPHIRVAPESIRTKAALIYDALNLFITVYSELDITETMAVKPLSCGGYEISDHGLRIAAFIRVRPVTKGHMIGPLSGPLEFDSLGRRTKFSLQIIERSSEGQRVTGVWNSVHPNVINVTISAIERKKEIQKQIQTRTFRVKSRLGGPYLMKRKAPEGEILRGNDRFEGYVKDLLDGVVDILNGTYELSLVDDGLYGNYDKKKKEWNGLIREILDRKADLAVCDLTITYERRKAVDFTMPFMTLGISILHSKARKEPPALLSFMNPLSLDVWLYMATAYLGISIVIFLVARLAPGDWENPHPCNQEPEQLENIWDLKNCFWLTMGSIMNQGCDILPKGISTRMVTAMWWFFSLIMTASYTANMAAFLTMERMGPTIESVEDLAMQSKIKYGMMENGATETFFKESNVSLYMKMWTQMQQTVPTVFEKNNADGVKRVRTSRGMYAFLMESTSLEYERNRYCDLKEVGRWLDIKGYGIAMPVNSPYRTEISGAVLKMQEMGKLHELKEKWWKGTCEKESDDSGSAARLGLSNVGGVFVVLAGGITTALLVALVEFLWNVKKTAVRLHISLREALAMEFKFAINVRIREKATKPPLLEPAAVGWNIPQINKE